MNLSVFTLIRFLLLKTLFGEFRASLKLNIARAEIEFNWISRHARKKTSRILGARIMRHRIAIAIAAAAFLLSSVAAMAQEGIGEISVQDTGIFTKDSDGNGTSQRTTASDGLLFGYRHHLYRWISAEAVYGYSRDQQQYFQPEGVARIQTNLHEATAGFVFKMPFIASFRPYLLAEGGALVFTPTNNAFARVAGARREAAGVFVYGVGVDHPLITSHVLVRAEYRGLIYDAPSFGLSNVSTGSVTHTAQPSAGLVFRF